MYYLVISLSLMFSFESNTFYICVLVIRLYVAYCIFYYLTRFGKSGVKYIKKKYTRSAISDLCLGNPVQKRKIWFLKYFSYYHFKDIKDIRVHFSLERDYDPKRCWNYGTALHRGFSFIYATMLVILVTNSVEFAVFRTVILSTLIGLPALIIDFFIETCWFLFVILYVPFITTLCWYLDSVFLVNNIKTYGYRKKPCGVNNDVSANQSKLAIPFNIYYQQEL